VEFWPPGIIELGESPDEVLAYYKSLGYRLTLLPDHDVSQLQAPDIVALGAHGKDHVTLLLTPL
jgi:hypothetical protein